MAPGTLVLRTGKGTQLGAPVAAVPPEAEMRAQHRFETPVGGPRPVVVGVDGWADGRRALLWAADEAARRGAVLHVVHVWQLPMYGALGPPVSPDGPHHADPIKAAVEAILHDSADLVHGRNPGIVVRTSLLTGDAADVLVEASAGAALVAIGCRGLPGLTGLVLGSVGGRLAARAHCPVVIVRGVREHRGPVVVGVSEGMHSVATLLAAADMAALRDAPLHVVHVGGSGRHHHPAPEEAATLDGWLRSWADDALRAAQLGDLEVTTQVIDGNPAQALLELSHGARLLVAGSHGHRPLVGVALGAVSNTITRRSDCPVMICPDGAARVRHEAAEPATTAHAAPAPA